MGNPPLDRIHIRDLLIRCILGIYPEERKDKQDVIINITLHADLSVAAQSDNIDDTINYKIIKKDVVEMVQQSEFFLLEKMADEIAGIALQNPQVRQVDVMVDKPGALRFARSVAIEITRTQPQVG
ncbi:MAG: dihydroneopterin aldolase [Candidatus Hydrogenedentota bacterium]|nr:MAG: dihydroneopterin aldolase [Candidatus Hydrogenedentota bacterium]